MSHYAPLSLQLDIARGTRIRFAHNPCGRVIVFVHGFKGNATDTWVDFPTMTPDRANCSGADLIFYQYDSLKTQPTITAGLLRKFIQSLWMDAAAISNATLPSAAHRPSRFRYEKLTLVAHSLGAVVTRLAMIDAIRARPMPDPWVCQTKLFLFAPAHKGAEITRLAVEGLSGLPVIGAYLNPLFSLFRQRYPVLRALVPGSTVLRELEERTIELLRAPGGAPLRAAGVVWGQHDNVVENLVFGDDPPSEVILGKGHLDVCKPSREFTRPLELLESLL